MTKKSKPPVGMTSEWPYFLDVEDIGARPLEVRFSADEDAARALSRRFAVEGLENVLADLTVHPVQGGVVHVTGQVGARIRQLCIVTQDPIETEVSEPVEGWFADQSRALSFVKAKKDRDLAKGHAELEILGEAEDPEPILNGRIDLGELAAQHLSLAIPLFPRKPGAVSPLTDEDIKAGKPLSGRKNPFEALKDWKEKR
jgi:uncharacterized metal-binding protein YceD (DUF177 family)